MKIATKITLLFCAVLMLQSCENSESQIEDLQLETLTYELHGEKTITFDVSPIFQHESRTFESYDTFNDFLVDEEEENKPLVINKEMWENLKHYWNPYKVAQFDKNYEITVDGKKHRVDSEAIYVQNSAGVWEMDVFYGLSGDVEYEEIKMVSLGEGKLETLKDYAFKSPSAKKYYEEKLRQPSKSKNSAFSLITPGNFAFTTAYNDIGLFQTNISLLQNGAYEVLYGPNQLRNSKNLQTRAAIAVFSYNEEYRNNLSARARGETALFIMDLDDGGVFVKDEWVLPCNNNQGYNTVNGTVYSSCDRNSDVSLPFESVRPYTFVKVYARDWKEDSGNKWHARELGVRRRNNRDASSRHQVHFRPNNWATTRYIFHKTLDRPLY